MKGSHLAAVMLFFWAAWFTLVAASNLCDGLQALGALPDEWRFVSGNFELMVKVTAIYSIPRAMVAAMFVGAIVWECLAAALFWRALFKRGATIAPAITVGTALFAAFVLSDEAFIAFPTGIESTHLLVLVALVTSWLVLRRGED